jgi:hypothetical protein
VKRLVALLVLGLVVLGAGYTYLVAKWSYSTGERAGWVQKFSRKGWVCKTWEGELAMVAMPGATPEKFYFTVWDDAVAERINKAMGQRVSLHYLQKVGLPSSCFGETEYWVDNLMVVGEMAQPPGSTAPSAAPPPPPAN